MAGSYFFDANAGESYEDTQRKRAIAEALMSQPWTARTPGQSIAQAAERIAGALIGRQAKQSDKAGRAAADERWAALNPVFPSAPVAPAGAEPTDYASSRVAQAFGDEGTPDYGNAIASIESGGRYDAIGPTHPKLGRALGKYQIMEANLPSWSKEALGREVSADEFLANPQIQDAIFQPKFQGYVAKYGPEGAAQAWFGGPGGVGKTGRKDSLGTSIGEYGQKFMSKLGQPSVGSQKIAQALSGGGSAPEMAGNVMSDAAGPSQQQLMQLAADPWQPEGRRGIAEALMNQQIKRQEADYARQQEMADPRTQLDMDLKRAQIAKMQQEGNGSDETFFGNPIAIKNADGSVSYGQLGNKGTFRPVNLGEGQSFAPPTKQIDTGVEIIHVDQAGNVISRVPKQNFQEAQEKAAGAGAGKSAAEVQSEYNSISSKMPGLRGVIDNLGKLADKATYTTAGQLIDWGMKEAGMEPREAAVARAEYTAIVDNQILPLLRDTFGAQFTAAEGEKLSRTLGDPNMSPTEKHAILKAFIEQKERDVAALQSRIGGQQDPATAPAAAPASDDPLGLF